MMACAAILGCTSAVNIETESTLEATQDQWTLPNDLVNYISRVDSKNTIGFRGAYKKCTRKNGDAKVCKTIERDVFLHKALRDWRKGPFDLDEKAVIYWLEGEMKEIERDYAKFNGDQS